LSTDDATTDHPVTERLRRLRAWAHGSPARALVVKAVATVVGVALLLTGLAMLVLPGPGLVVMGLGLGALATEWAWARRLLLRVRAVLSATRRLLFPTGASAVRRAAGGAAVATFGVLGFLATAGVTAFLGARTLV
jgi:hypothetical protein